MSKNNLLILIVVAGLIGFGGGFIYFDNKNKPIEQPALDNHGHYLPANVSFAALDNLLDKSAPFFELSDRNGRIYSLENLKGKNIVLFFNEGLMCYPACWNQIVALADDERFKNDDTVVLSVVIDSSEEWEEAIRKMPELEEAVVVFDKGAEVSNKFGMLKTESSMHYGAFPGHTYVIIDKKGIVRYVFDDPNMAIRNDEIAAEISKI